MPHRRADALAEKRRMNIRASGARHSGMAFDRNRPVPWPRLLREAAIFAVVASLTFALVIGERDPGIYIGIVAGLAIYVGLGALLAKFGYRRQTLGELRAQSRADAAAAQAARARTASSARPKPAPTKRTGAGHRKR
jgi:hypothetical protein